MAGILMPGMYVGFDPILFFAAAFVFCGIGYLLFGKHTDES